MTHLMLFAAAFVAGIINSVAGGGSFLTFPALVFAGVPAVAANATSTVAMLPSAFASTVSYRGDIGRLQQERIVLWLIISLIGGVAGSVLLLSTSETTFRHIVPWLLLLATLLFAFGNQVSLAFRGDLHQSQILLLLLLFPIAVYGGYFGGGGGIMVLAAFRLYGLTDIHSMNGVKTLLMGTLNFLAAVIFILAHKVHWAPALLMMGAGIAGGYLGPVLVRRLPPTLVRRIVIAVGAVMTAWFFYLSMSAK
jgi:uncharacterized protein